MVTPSGPLIPLVEVAAVDEVKFGCPMTTLAFIPVVSGGSNISTRLLLRATRNRRVHRRFAFLLGQECA
jgi:hypothetical protein